MMGAEVRIQTMLRWRYGEGKGGEVARRISGNSGGLKPHVIWTLYAALKRRSSTLVSNGAEDFADFAGEGLQGEGFLQEGGLGIGGGWGGEGVFGVAGEIEDLDGGASGQGLLEEFVAAAGGDDDPG